MLTDRVALYFCTFDTASVPGFLLVRLIWVSIRCYECIPGELHGVHNACHEFLVNCSLLGERLIIFRYSKYNLIIFSSKRRVSNKKNENVKYLKTYVL